MAHARVAASTTRVESLSSSSAPAGGHEVRAVDEGEAFLGGQGDRLEVGGRERVGTVDRFAVDDRLALAEQDGRQAWARGARSPEAPTEPIGGTTGVTPALSMATRGSTSSRRTPERPARQRRGEQQQHGADGLCGRGSPDTRGMGAQQVALDLRELGVVDPCARQRAEAGVDAVDGLAGCRAIAPWRRA